MLTGRVLATNQLVIAARYAESHRDPAGAPGQHTEQVRQVQLAGEGSALVSEYAALALGTTADAATVLIAHAVELRDRLPALWARVTAGEVEAWRARQVAAVTIAESPQVVTLVDEDLDTTKRAIHTPTAQDAVTAAVAQLDAEDADAVDVHDPPGQTRPDNLACLCRRHPSRRLVPRLLRTSHRLKTHAGWTYRRVGEGYAWAPPARAA